MRRPLLTASTSDQPNSNSTDLSVFTPERPLLLLGCGKMGGALLDGWLSHGLDPRATVILDPYPAETLKEIDGLTLRTDGTYDGPAPHAVMLAVKPQMMNAALPVVAGMAQADALYISIAAGKPLAYFEEMLGADTAIVRVMPNTPAAVGAGASALIANAACSAEDKALATAMTDSVGISVWLESEDQMDAVTGVSGSGPAYIFHMIEALTAAAESEGLAPELALALARQTVVGAAALAGASPDSAETLRVNVTSPKGTTEAGLIPLMDGKSGLTSLMRETVKAAANRSRELRS